MPSLTHEALVDLFRNRPTLAVEMLRHLAGEPLDGASVPPFPIPPFAEARLSSSDLAEVLPADRRADLVILLTDPDERPLLAIVVEVQLGADPDKPYVWPVYLSQTRAQHRCPVCLLVVTIEPEMVRWCSRPIPGGHPGWVLTPIVLGPQSVPVVTAPDDARAAPELAVLSVMAHGHSDDGAAIARACLLAAAGLDEERCSVYTDLVLISLNQAARTKLEAMMKSGYQYQSDFARTYVAQGLEEGLKKGLEKGRIETEARAVLTVLDARGLSVPPEVREHVLALTDLDHLERLLRRAVVVSDATQLLDPES